MKLTQKDRQFALKLRALMEEENLVVDMTLSRGARMILRRNYGTRIESTFGMSRQGIRWRFHRIFNEMYVEAYVTILWLESTYGVRLRDMAMAIAHERAENYRRIVEEESQLNVARERGGSQSSVRK